MAASSSSVIVTFVRFGSPPASDTMIILRPVGETSRKSLSSGNVWVQLVSVTVTLLIVVGAPTTVMFDG